MREEIGKYFSDWEGWFCKIEDKDGESCGEVIENDRGSLINHLREKHGIEVELE